MKTKTQPRRVTVNRKQRLYVIPSPCGGYSCLGFRVCIDRAVRLAAELGEDFKPARAGALSNYRRLCELQEIVRDRHSATGYRATCELSPQLRGLEGRHVEVVTDYGETRRFRVGRSTGCIPIHLEITRRCAHGGFAAEYHYKSVRVIR